jgi:uncharacterized RDD family membrane protein YckC
MHNQTPLNPYAAPTSDLTPHVPGDGSLQLATRMARLGGAIVDGILYALVGWMGVFALGGNPFKVDPNLPWKNTLVAWGFQVPLALYQWYRIARKGQSLGKSVAGTRIVLMDGTPVNFATGVVLRSWVLGSASMLPMLVPLFDKGLTEITGMLGGSIGLVDTMLIFGEEHRCMHDRIAGTKVVKI